MSVECVRAEGLPPTLSSEEGLLDTWLWLPCRPSVVQAHTGWRALGLWDEARYEPAVKGGGAKGQGR